jgi:hypothetical protein
MSKELEDKLRSMKVGDLKKEISKTNVRGYSKLKKEDVIKFMLANKNRFMYLVNKDKKFITKGGKTFPVGKKEAKKEEPEKELSKEERKEKYLDETSQKNTELTMKNQIKPFIKNPTKEKLRTIQNAIKVSKTFKTDLASRIHYIDDFMARFKKTDKKLYDEYIKVAKQVIQKAKDDKKAKQEKKKKVKTVEVEKREVKKPQGPTPQRKPKSKPTQDEYQMNVRKYRELIKQYIENPNEETLKKINKLDDIQKDDPYRNEVPKATFEKFEKLKEQKDAPSKKELKEYRDKIEELLKIKKETLMKDKKLFEKFEKLADNKLFEFLPESLTDKLISKLDIDDDEFIEEPKPQEVKKELSKIDKLKEDLKKFQNELDQLAQPRSAKTADIAEKLIDMRTKLSSKIANIKFSIFEEEGKQKDRDEKERIKKEKKELADFKKAVNDFIKKPTEELLEFIDNKFELTDDIPESLLNKLEKAIDKFNKS